MNINNRPIPSIQQVQNERFSKQTSKKQVVPQNDSFSSILNQQLVKNNIDTLKFSKHANARLNSRNIELSSDQISRLENGVEKAAEKGIKESLVLMDDVALVVNIENRTVVTALGQSEAHEHVFTNIDGAVVL